MDEGMKWQQYPLVSMSVKGKSSGYVSKLNFMPFIASDLSAKVQGVSEWLNLTAFLGTADSEVHIVRTSRVITAYTFESLSSFT